VTYREFRRSCRIYGFEGKVHSLFHALDVEKNGALSVDEVAFLDDWEFVDPHSQDESQVLPQGSYSLSQPQTRAPNLPEYYTQGPGPGAYCLPTTVGAGPVAPMTRFSGAYSFRKRQPAQLPGINRDAGFMPAPTAYDDRIGWCAVSPSKPSWAFGNARRESNEPPALDPDPGPGHYSPARLRGPAISCTPRRALRVHPLFHNAVALPQCLGSPLRSPERGLACFSGLT